jgi:general secretion pathway protein A
MYLEFFNLKEFPFSIACDEKYFYESEIHAEALGNMVYAVTQRKGMVLISGQVGAGKTFLGGMLASRLGLSVVVVAIKHPPGSAKQLLRALAGGLGVKVPPEADIMAVAEQVQEALERCHRRNRLVAVLIDEVQDLPDEVLEEVRLIWNWELDSQRLAQIILVGQPEIRQRLMQPRWESLRQRIVLSYHLGRLSPGDTQGYIRHRIGVAAADSGSQDGLPRFSPEAIEAIHKATKGTPRLINSLCDNALLTAYARSRREITAGTIESVLCSMTFWAPAPAARPADENPAPRQEDPPAEPAPPPQPPVEPSPQAEGPRPGDEPGPAEADGNNPDRAAADCPPNGRPNDCPPADWPVGTGPVKDRQGAEDSLVMLRAALLGEPSPEMARRAYMTAPAGSEVQHLALRILAQHLMAAMRAGS